MIGMRLHDLAHKKRQAIEDGECRSDREPKEDVETGEPRRESRGTIGAFSPPIASRSEQPTSEGQARDEDRQHEAEGVNGRPQQEREDPRVRDFVQEGRESGEEDDEREQ